MAAATLFPLYAMEAVSFSNIVSSVTKLTERVFHVTMKYFGLMQSAGVFGFGLQEIVLGYLPVKWSWGKDGLLDDESHEIQNLQQVKNIKGIQAEQSCVHGLFYLGSGVLCSLGEMEEINVLNLGGCGSALLQSGWTLFLFANLFSLDQNIKLYCAASRLGETLGHRLKVSAILGIINNLSYVIGTLCSFFKGMQLIAITLAVLAIMAGTIKFFYDFFCVSLPV